MNKTNPLYVYVLLLILLAAPALAVPGLTTYQARIIKPDNQPLEGSAVNFRFTILNPNANCVLYVEDYSAINMNNTSGLASFSLGTGTKIYAPTSGTTFADVFNNASSPLLCQGGGGTSFTATVNDVRKIVMQFNDGTGWQTLPAMSINAVPYAMYATKSDNSVLFNNKADTVFVQYTAIPTCTGSQTLQYTGSAFLCINGGGGGGGSITAGDITTALGYTPANPALLSTSYTTTASFSTVTATVNSLGSSVTAVTSVVDNLSASMSAIVNSQWVTSGTAIHYMTGNVGINTVSPQQKLSVSGVLLVSGEYGSGESLVVSGAGARMFFYPKKSAFRAGYANADEWDDANIGDASIALGEEAIALGYGAIAIGSGVTASGTNAVAMGRYSQALGEKSTALGEGQAIGDLSTAFDSSYAAGMYSVAMGSSSANGDRSISIGPSANANGEASIAIGQSTRSNAYRSLAVGSYNVGNGSGAAWVATDPIFEIGNSQNGSPRSNAVTVLKNGNVGIGKTQPVTTLEVSGAIRISMDSATCVASYAGAIRYNSGLVQYCDGTTWSSLGVAGAGITGLNGSTSGTQSFANGVSGSSPAFVTLSGVHTLNIPLASATGSVTAGLISNADYINFSNKMNATSAAVISALGYTPANPATLSASFTTTTSFSALAASMTTLNNIPVYWNANNSIFVGSGTAKTSTTANNTTLGVSTLASVTTAVKNVAIGTNAMTSTLYGSANVAVGYSSMYNNTIGDYNTAVGHLAMYENTTGWSNTALGSWALYRIVDGWYNTGIGESSLDRVTSGTENVALGASAGRAVITGSGNTFIGTQSGEGQGPALSDVSGNTFLGFLTGQDVLTGGNNNTLIGYRVGDTLTTGIKNIVIGYNIDTLTPTSSNTLNIGNLIYGTNLNGQNTAISSGSIRIGVTAPVTKLDVSGAIRISMDSATCVASYAGAIRYNAGVVQYCDGATWSSFGVAGSGINGFNGSTSATQSLANGVTGNAPAFVTANGVHTLNIPLASATGSVSAGLISNADYVNFSNKITSSAASIVQVLGYVPASATALGNYLVKTNNLSDLTSSATARTNLGLGTFATANTIDLGSASATGTLAAARLPAHSGDVTSVSGSAVLTLANSGVSAATYTKVTVNAKGLVTSGSQLISSDITTALGYTPVSAAAASQWVTSGTTINYPTGNVGIGTAAPTARLSIESSGVPGIQIKKSGAAVFDTFNMINDMDATGYFWLARGTNASAAPTSTNRLMGVTNEGAVEIYGQAVNAGTDNSGILSLKTQASGDGGTKNEVSMEFYADRADLNTSSGFVGYESGTAFDLSLINNKSGNLNLGTNGVTKMTMSSVGYVGIGTSAPTGILDVRAGTAGAGVDGTPVTIYAQNAGSGNRNGGNISLVPGTGTGTGYRGSVQIATGTFYNAAQLEIGSGAPGLAINNTGNSQILLNHGGGGWGVIGNNSAGKWSLGYANTSSTNLDGSVLTWTNSGYVGVGSTAPRAALDVSGTVLMKPAVSITASPINFLNGNLQYTTNNCGAFALHNMKDGGSYTFAVKGATAATCAFTAFSDAGTTGLTVHMPSDHGATTASKHTLYTFLVMGTDVYVSWMPDL